MKKLFLILAVLFFALPVFGQAIESKKELTFEWEQRIADLPHLGGWGLYMRSESGGTPELTIDLPYTGTEANEAGTVITSKEFIVTGVPGAIVRKYFVADAYNKIGTRTVFSNEVFYDFEIPVADVTAPVTLKVSVIIKPQ